MIFALFWRNVHINDTLGNYVVNRTGLIFFESMCFDILSICFGHQQFIASFLVDFLCYFCVAFLCLLLGNINLAANIDRQLMFYVINMERVQYGAH